MSNGRMFSPIPVLLAGWVVTGPAHAGLPAAVVQSGLSVQTGLAGLSANQEPVPEDVRVATTALKQACETWRRSVQSPAKMSGPVPSSDLRVPLPGHGLCDVIEDAEHALNTALWLAGWLGAVAMVFALGVFCAVRGVLLSLWNWRLPIGARPW